MPTPEPEEDKAIEKLEEECDPYEHPIHYLFSFLIIGLAIAYMVKELIPPGFNLIDEVCK